MRQKKDPNIFLQHILECIDRIDNNITDTTKNAFLTDQDAQDVIVRRLEIIGEAVRNLPHDFRNKHPNIPWRKIAGFRDILIHEYFDVDIDLVWKIVTQDVPKLKKQIVSLLKNNI